MRVLLSSALANVWFSKTLSQLLIGKVFKEISAAVEVRT